MSDKMVEEMARAMAEVIAKRHGHAPENWLNDQRREEAQAAATIAERRMEEAWRERVNPTEAMIGAGLAELAKWLGTKPEEIDDLVVHSVWLEMTRAALRPSGGV